MTLTQAERQYFIRKAGGADPIKPLNQIKREYFAAQTGGATPRIPLRELERRWMRSVLVAADITPAGTESDMWKQLVSAVSKTPVQQMNQNKVTFYLNAE